MRDQSNEAAVTTEDRDIIRFDVNDGVPHNSYTDTTVFGYKSIHTAQVVQDTLELPIGIVIDILNNLNLQLGAKHTVIWQTSNYRSSIPDFTPMTTTRVRDDGARSSSVDTPQSNAAAYSRSAFDSWHTSSMTYGLTWWAYENLQIDVTGFNSLTGLSNYNLSVNLYF